MVFYAELQWKKRTWIQFKLTAPTIYITTTEELWGAYCEYKVENLLCLMTLIMTPKSTFFQMIVDISNE